MNAYMLVAWNPNETVRVKHPRHGMWLERATVVRLCGSRYSLATHKRFQPTPAEVTDSASDSARLYGRTLERTR